ncbi:hypothetical protein N0B40_09865 [Chryseobacterium oranimense]|uniref:hypothetical protein n=1 Tax=Chryseobacterium oranimense TaxID=421058 RepID=UPI0021AFC256|nr:hypothetical protein [Chryseobacterium oranimense]UWX62581.1 hypothetical protein N0B40_09865 [Chryseobacterium oranimense]
MLTISSSLCFAQVGINTDMPKATFEIKGKSTITDVDGIIVPRLTRQQLTSKGNTLYGTDQNGTIIYITDVSAGDNLSQRSNILSAGYYYFDGMANLWQKMITQTDAVSMEPWQIAGSSVKATSNVQNIYQNANVSIGDYSATLPTERLDVNGNARIRSLPDADPTQNQYKVTAKSDGTLSKAYEKIGYRYGTGAFDNLDLTNVQRGSIKDIYFFTHGANVTLPKASNTMIGVEISLFIGGGSPDSYTTGLAQDFTVNISSLDTSNVLFVFNNTTTAPYSSLIKSWGYTQMSFVNNLNRTFRILNFKLIGDSTGIYRWIFWASGV